MEKQIEAILIERIDRAKNIASFRFRTKERIDFLPGQFTQLIFDVENSANRELNKYLSFSSSPTKDYIEVTKRLTESEFSKRLENLKPGDSLLLKSPMGNCVFNEEDKQIAFLVGGIGITPVISIIEYIVDEKLDVDIVVFYSSRTEDIAFRNQLDNWQKSHNNIQIFYTITDCEPKDKQCLSGAINEDLVKQRMGNCCGRTVFIFGPPAMVEAMKNLCFRVGCDKSAIKAEKFIGY